MPRRSCDRRIKSDSVKAPTYVGLGESCVWGLRRPQREERAKRAIGWNGSNQRMIQGRVEGRVGTRDRFLSSSKTRRHPKLRHQYPIEARLFSASGPSAAHLFTNPNCTGTKYKPRPPSTAPLSLIKLSSRCACDGARRNTAIEYKRRQREEDTAQIASELRRVHETETGQF